MSKVYLANFNIMNERLKDKYLSKKINNLSVVNDFPYSFHRFHVHCEASCDSICPIVINPLSPDRTKWPNTNNSWAVADKLFECVWPFCGVGA